MDSVGTADALTSDSVESGNAENLRVTLYGSHPG